MNKQILKCVPNLKLVHRCYASLTNKQVIAHRGRLFEEEKQRQLKEIERIEKIEVKVINNEDEVVLMMNKGLSTPFNCAMRNENIDNYILIQDSVLAQLNNEVIWDMHRPLEESCEIRFLHFKDQDPTHVNKAYWRSCSMLLGYLLETAFKDQYFVDLCSFPPPNIQSGSFIYDASINVDKWSPNKEELRCMSIAAFKLAAKNLNFERLLIKPELAKEMFKYNKYKLEQIPSILENQESKNSITVYKIGDFVDISKGPMISNTSLIGRYEVTGVFDLETDQYGKIQRIQGVSIPTQLQLHTWTFNLLVERASKLNDRSFKLPNTQGGLFKTATQ